jgi:cell division protease FtsH
MVTHYGMSEALGLATYGAQPARLYLDGPALPEQRNCSERTAEAIDAEVRRLLDESRSRVAATLSDQRPALDALAALLLEKEVVDRRMLDELLHKRSTPSTVASPVARAA